MVRFGFAPGKIRFLAEQAFAGVYSEAEIDQWLSVFLRRFFTSTVHCRLAPTRAGSLLGADAFVAAAAAGCGLDHFRFGEGVL